MATSCETKAESEIDITDVGVASLHETHRPTSAPLGADSTKTTVTKAVTFAKSPREEGKPVTSILKDTPNMMFNEIEPEERGEEDSDIERYLGNILRDPKGNEKEPSLPPPKCGILRMTLAEWATTPTGSETPKQGVDPSRQGYVLEVLVEEPINIVPGQLPWREGGTQPSGADDFKLASIAARLTSSSVPKSWSKSPSQLRIKSMQLKFNLQEISPRLVSEPQDAVSDGLAIVRPFKMLFLYEKEIRERHQELEKMYAHTGSCPKTDAADEGLETPAANGMGERKLALDGPPAERMDNGEPEEAGIRTPDAGDAARRRKEITRTPAPLSASPSLLKLKRARERNKEKDSHTALEHFRLLIRFMDEDLKELFELRHKIREGKLQKIAFDDLWHLFDYGQEVLIKDKEQPGKTTAHKVLKFTGGRNIRVNFKRQVVHKPIAAVLGPGMWDGAFAVQCWSLGFGSGLYWPHEKVVGIRRYDGEKEITSLPVYPMKFDSRPQLRKTLIDQGRVFKHFASTRNLYRRYYGRNLDKYAFGEHIDSQVIIDFEEAIKQNEAWRPHILHAENDQIDHDYRELHEEFPYIFWETKGYKVIYNRCPDYELDQTIFDAFIKDKNLALETKDDIDDSELILLPDWVFGYVLNDKIWAKLSTSKDCLQEIQATSDPWNDLVLDEGAKETIEALVTQHLRGPISSNETDTPFQLGDFIAGKGRGLVFLLHGPPGVGKTSTAECIAAHMNRPLYPLTSGNLGVSSDKLEDSLQFHFMLAERWGCILLLDEADVFLQRRRLNELQVNAIVSVFLRQLEYYKGVLFLTTNRVGDMDPAFKSRIHVTLEYAPLDRKRTKKIYRLHIKRIKEALDARKKKSGKDFIIRDEEILAWAEKHFKASEKMNRQWNGRQIHNAFQTAVALAEWKSRGGDNCKGSKSKELILGKKQFKQVAKVSEGFDQYMTDLMGGKDESTIAAGGGQRLDFRLKGAKYGRKEDLSSDDSDSDENSDKEPQKKRKEKAAADSDKDISSNEE